MTTVVERVLLTYHILHQILDIITDNAKNNRTFMRSFINYINFCSTSRDESTSSIIINIDNDDINDSVANENEEDKQRNIDLNSDDYSEHILCLTHVLQLTLKTLLEHVRVTFTNKKF